MSYMEYIETAVKAVYLLVTCNIRFLARLTSSFRGRWRSILIRTIPVGIWCQNDVVSTSIYNVDAISSRRIDVDTTSFLKG